MQRKAQTTLPSPASPDPFDHEGPGVADLDLALLQALRHAATDAADEDLEFYVHSGWRSPEYQARFFVRWSPSTG